MIFLTPKLKQFRRQSAPDAAFKSTLRARLVGSEPAVHPVSFGVARYTFATVVVALIMFLSVGSYAYASSGVTEGDALYPVKTGIEKIEGNLKRSPEARARFHARMMDRRFREIAYRLNHHQALTPGDVATLAKAMNVSVDELKTLESDEAGRELAKTNLKLELTNSLTQFRARIELSDLTSEQKAKYYKAIDLRLERVNQIQTTAP